MTNVLIDKTILGSYFESYKNYERSQQSMVISTLSIADGASRTVTADIPYDRGGTKADVYVTGKGVKTIANVGSRASANLVYTPVSFEDVKLRVAYFTGFIRIEFIISNFTGGSISPIAQTIVASLVKYDAPITSI